MTNRIAGYDPDSPHPLDAPTAQAKHRVLAFLFATLIIGLAVVLIGVSGTVIFALGGRPLPKNGAMLSGIPILTVIGAILTMSAVMMATVIVPFLTKSGLTTIARRTGGEADESESDALLALYSKTKFLEAALAEGAGVVTAILFHLSADWLMIAFAGGMLAFLLLRFPTKSALRTWYDRAVEELAALRRSE